MKVYLKEKQINLDAAELEGKLIVGEFQNKNEA